MPPSAGNKSPALVLVCGEDEFAVKQRAKQLHLQWTQELGGMDHEITDAAVANSREALEAIGKLRESLQTLPFFGDGKAIWFKNCTFLGDERTASAQAVTEALSDLAAELKSFDFRNVRLLISAGKVDKRKSFFKTLDKIGNVELFEGWSVDDKDWAEQAENWAREALASRKKEISHEALGALIDRIGPNNRILNSEVEKLSLYVGDRPNIELEDVSAICARNKMARAFALGDALGDRDLPRVLKRLDETLWEVKLDSHKSEIGVLYGLIGKVRALLLLKEMLREGWVKPNVDFGSFRAQLDKIPADQLPADRRLNAYVLYKALPQVKRYSQAELVRAMEILFQCNQRLVSTGLDESLVLQQALVQIVGSSAPRSDRSAN